MLFHGILSAVPRSPDEPTKPTLEAALAAHEDLGLRYVGLVLRDAPPIFAGESVSRIDAYELAGPTGLDLDVGEGVVRMWSPGGPPPPELKFEGAPPMPRDPRYEARRGAFLVIEFVPTLAHDLLGRAERNLAVGIAGALMLVLVSSVLWRLSKRASQVERVLSEQRHLAALGEMSAVLAHELRNPLSSLKGHAQLLEEDLDGDAKDRVGRVVKEAFRLETLISSLLSFVRSGTIDRTAADPVEVLRAAIDEVGAKHRVVLEVDGAPSVWSLDQERMRRALVNVVANAVQASGPDEKIEVSVGITDGVLMYRIRDRGPGVPPADRESIFEPFKTARVQGTGLGLAVARRVVHLHGGRITVSDADGGGAVFTIEVPEA